MEVQASTGNTLRSVGKLANVQDNARGEWLSNWLASYEHTFPETMGFVVDSLPDVAKDANRVHSC